MCEGLIKAPTTNTHQLARRPDGFPPMYTPYILANATVAKKKKNLKKKIVSETNNDRLREPTVAGHRGNSRVHLLEIKKGHGQNCTRTIGRLTGSKR